MNHSTLVLYRGSDFETQTPKRFVKDVLRVGRWIHPITKQEVVITPERMRALVRDTEEYRQTLDRKAIPFQDGHNFDAKKTLGWWNRFWVQGDRLYGEVDVTDAEAAKKIQEGSIRSVSARIDPKVNDTKGGVFDEAFTHVCATPVAVLDGQEDFHLKLSREAEPVQLYIELSGIVPAKETLMTLQQIAVLLGLPETAKPEDIGEAAKKLVGGQKTALDQVKAEQDRFTALASSLKEHGFEAKDGKAVKLAAPPPGDETPREKEYRERAERAERATNLARLQDVKTKIEAASKEQIVPPALIPAFMELASIESDIQALCLSADGQSTQKKAINAATRVMEIIKGLPKLNAQSLTLSAEQTDEQKKIEESAKKKSSEVLARTGLALDDEGK